MTFSDLLSQVTMLTKQYRQNLQERKFWNIIPGKVIATGQQTHTVNPLSSGQCTVKVTYLG